MMTAVTFVPPEKPLPGAKLCCQLLFLVWDFLPSSGSPFIGLLRCGDVLSSPRSHPCISPITEHTRRVTERRRQNLVEDSTQSGSPTAMNVSWVSNTLKTGLFFTSEAS